MLHRWCRRCRTNNWNACGKDVDTIGRLVLSTKTFERAALDSLECSRNRSTVVVIAVVSVVDVVVVVVVVLIDDCCVVGTV